MSGLHQLEPGYDFMNWFKVYRKKVDSRFKQTQRHSSKRTRGREDERTRGREDERTTHRVRDDEGFLTLGHFLLSNTLMQQTHTLCYTHTLTIIHNSPTCSLQLHQETMQRSEQENSVCVPVVYLCACVCVCVCLCACVCVRTCSHQSCHVLVLLLRKQRDWLVSRGHL